MVICENLKEKVIIIADNNDDAIEKTSAFLNKYGFVNIRIAKEGAQIYEILRQYYNEPEKVGLIIVNEELPQCQLHDMYKTLSGNENSLAVPFIILSSKTNSLECDYEESDDFYSEYLRHYLSLPINFSELLIVVRFQLMIRHERYLRIQQEEYLINELAERKVVDAKLKYLVAHDELTSLLNRQNFERQLRQILNRNHLLNQNGALLFIDIDRFSLINELEGFETGDRMLVEVISIIRRLTVGKGLLARIGSDEFCLYLDNKTVKKAKLFAEKIRTEIYDFRFFTGDVCYNTSVSIGISGLNTAKAVYHPSELISRARQACNMAKEYGRNLVWEYDEENSKVQERHKDIFWVPFIRKALLEKKFFLVFQPVVDLANDDVSHYEVLIRMRGSNNEVITPNEFIPVAERMGLIHSIDMWVVEKAIDFLADIPAKMSNISLSINLSSLAFQDETLLPAIKDKLEITWVDARRITFEITETAAVDNFEQTREMIAKIRALGCKFALDDFGAGFCSFNYLKTFPVDYVKIDGQFIQNLVNDETDQVLVKSMAEIATKLGKKTIAEFVETPKTVQKLKELGVNMAQGYIFGEPKVELLSHNIISLAE